MFQGTSDSTCCIHSSVPYLSEQHIFNPGGLAWKPSTTFKGFLSSPQPGQTVFSVQQSSLLQIYHIHLLLSIPSATTPWLPSTLATIISCLVWIPQRLIGSSTHIPLLHCSQSDLLSTHYPAPSLPPAPCCTILSSSMSLSYEVFISIQNHLCMCLSPAMDCESLGSRNCFSV
jgi:hypothetical protein